MLTCLAEILLGFVLTRLRHAGGLTPRHRALWLQQSCALIVRRLGMRVEYKGPLPESGLVVSNHLSYLDILFYATITPCVFVSKSDVRSWPLFGLFARCAGTIFITRERTSAVGQAARQITEALHEKIPVLLFPEGTSTDGGTVLPFHSSLFEPALQAHAAITAAAIGYSIDGGRERDLCYYGDITFGPHLVRVLGMGELRAGIQFGTERNASSDRKTAARELHGEVTAMRALIKDR
ncbi:lysophospholipid acyltransferase family protein [Paracidobacterium acidisoli]|nr:lysophospholipid acyltransferase family protein [Paracidobacterium acidisoli]MBT9330490.1 1-acyl-sn-glycerol-3-phosphate acyltransferase [Paracidobacterium acidisoli]